MKKTHVILVFVILLVLFCCSVFVYPKIGLESANNGYEYMDTVFNQSQVTTVDIELDDEALTTMLENAADEEVVEANVTINGTTVNNVGLRTKGNLTLRSVVQMEDSERYSFKIDFDYYDDTKSLDGLKKLNLNNNYSDASQMREYMSYKMMEQLGVPTPGYSYMYVTINGEDWGLYLGVEAIEETFLARNFTKGSDSLYKPDGTGSDLKYISDSFDDYSGINPKTTISESDEEEFIDFINAINEEGADLSSVMNVDEMLRYFAASTALVNLDSYHGNMKHNYYLYEEDGLFSILPWDYNMSFGGFGGGGKGGRDEQINATDKSQRETAIRDTSNNDLPAQDADEDTEQGQADAEGAEQSQARPQMGMMGGNALTESNINLSIYEPVSGTTMEDRPLLNALLTNDEYLATYEEYISEVASSFLAKDNFTQMVDEVYTLIKPYVEKDPTSFFTVEEFEEDVHGDKGIIEFASQRSESILAQLSGELVVESPTSNESSSTTPEQNGMQPPNGGEMQGGMQPPNGGEMPEGMQPPNGGEMPENGQLPEGMQSEAGERTRPNGQNDNAAGPGFGENNSIDNQPAGYSTPMIVASAISVVGILLLTFAISKFKRRRI